MKNNGCYLLKIAANCVVPLFLSTENRSQLPSVQNDAQFLSAEDSCQKSRSITSLFTSMNSMTSLSPYHPTESHFWICFRVNFAHFQSKQGVNSRPVMANIRIQNWSLEVEGHRRILLWYERNTYGILQMLQSDAHNCLQSDAHNCVFVRNSSIA